MAPKPRRRIFGDAYRNANCKCAREGEIGVVDGGKENIEGDDGEQKCMGKVLSQLQVTVLLLSIYRALLHDDKSMSDRSI